jgi:hypothetical protein
MLQQTHGGQDEPIYRFHEESQLTPQHGTKNAKTHNRTTQKNEKMGNTDSAKKPEVNSGAREG